MLLLQLSALTVYEAVWSADLEYHLPAETQNIAKLRKMNFNTKNEQDKMLKRKTGISIDDNSKKEVYHLILVCATCESIVVFTKLSC